MSGAAVRLPYEEARGIAHEMVRLLEPACKSVKIAGSIRRAKLDIGDIDLVIEPLLIPTPDLFGGEDGPPVNAFNDLCDEMVELGIWAKRLDKNGRQCWGSDLKRAVYRGLSVDLQTVSDHDTWGMWFLIRTGPAAWNKRIVTPQRKGGLLPAGCEFRDGFQLWRWGERIPTPTERSVFEALGIDFLNPWERR